MEKILIIDDDAKTRTTIRTILEGAGYNVVEADDGKSGVDLYKKESPTLVITDILMPISDGIEAIVEFRKMSPEQKIIAISGGGEIEAESYLAMAKKLGASHVLPKPFGKKDLLDVVEKSLQ